MTNNNLMMFEGNDVEVFELNGQVLFNPKHVGEILGITDVRSSIRGFSEKQVVKVKNSDVNELSFRKINNAGENFLTENGVLALVNNSCNCSQEKKEKLIHFLFPQKDIIVINDVKEINFLDMLEDFLLVFGITGIRQYKVLNYRIDYYIPSLKIAIEYDENDHSGYSYESQELRQKIIEKELKCKFIRLSDKEENAFNLGLAVKGITT